MLCAITVSAGLLVGHVGASSAAVVAQTSTVDGLNVDGGSLVLEASSSHMSIQLYWEDKERRRTSFEYLTVLPERGDAGGLVWTVLSGAADNSPGEGAARMGAERDWEALAGLPAGATPDVALQYKITLAPHQREDVRAQIADLNKHFAEVRGASFADYSTSAIGMLKGVLIAAEFELPLTATTSTPMFPGSEDEVSPLSWLYMLMQLNSGGLGSALEGCTTAHRVPLAVVRGSGVLGGLIAATRMTLRGAIVGAVNLNDNVKRYLDEHDDEADLLALGHFDPVMVDILDCQMRQIVRGSDLVPASIIERSQIYAAFDRFLLSPREKVPDFFEDRIPRFFEAAHQVTRPLGVGFVDIADHYKLESGALWSGLLRVADMLDIVDGNTAPIPPYSGEARSLLRTLNGELFELNKAMMRRLFARQGGLFDPLGTDNAVTKRFSPGMTFDLRMVIAEQTRIETYLVNENLMSNEALMGELTAASRILPSVEVEAIFEPIGGGRFAHLETLREVYRAVAAMRIKPDFANVKYRIAIGSAYVFLLHGQDLSGLEAYLKALWPTLRLGALPPKQSALDNRVREILMSPDTFPSEPDGIGSGAAKLERALSAFLSPDASQTFWFDCDPEHPEAAFSRTTPANAIAPVSARARLLSAAGPGIAIPAFELLGSGGAMDGAAHPPKPYSEKICRAIQQRRVALDCALAATGPDACAEALSTSVVIEGTDGDDASLFMFAESQGLKAEAAQLAPFLSEAVDRWNGQPDTLPGILALARTSASDYARDVALLQALKADAEAARGLFGEDFKADALEATLRTFEDPDELLGSLSNGTFVQSAAAVAAMENWLSLDNQRRVTAARRRALDRLLSPLRPLYMDEDGAKPLELAVAKAVATAQGVSSEVITVAPAIAANLSSEIAATFAGTGLNVKLTQSSVLPDGTPLYSAELTYRRPLGPTNSASACVARKGETCSVTSAQSGEEEIPLGITVLNVVRPASGGFRASAVRGENDVVFDADVAAAALRRFGMPDVLDTQRVRAEVSADLQTVALRFNFGISGLVSDSVRLPVLENGKLADVPRALEAEVQAKLAAIDLSQSFSALRLPSIGQGPDGLRLTPEPEGAEIGLDWKGQALYGRIAYRLAIGSGDAEASVRASAEILGTLDGFKVRTMTFAPEGVEAFRDRLLADYGLTAEFNPALGNIAVVPDYANGVLGFTISASLSTGECAIPVSVRVTSADLENPAAIASALLVDAEGAAAAAANCAIDRAVAGVEALLEGGKLSLFGIELGIENARDLLIAYRADPGLGRLQPVLSLNDTDECAIEGPSRGIIRGIGFDISGNDFSVDLSGLNDADKTAERRLLGRSVECRIARFVAPGGTLQIDGMEIGKGIISANVTIRGLPWLGDLTIGRINLAAVGNQDFMKSLGDTALAAVEANATRLLVYKFAGTTDVPGIGALTLIPDGTSVRLFGDAAGITLHGNVDIKGIQAVGDIVIPFKGLPGSVSVKLSAGDSIVANVLGMLGGFLPFEGGGVTLDGIPRVEPLDAGGRRYGLVFGLRAKIGFGAGEDIEVGLRRVVISQDGIRLGGQIRLRVGQEIPLGYVSLTNITVIYDTGEGGTRKGVILETDIAPFQATLGYIVKLAVLLDLRELGDARFTMKGDLVVLSGIDLMLTSGVVNLKEFGVKFDGRTAPAISDVLDIQGTGEFNGDRGTANAQTSFAILGINLQRQTMQFCARACEGGEARSLHIGVQQNLLIGEADIKASSKLDFSAAKLGAAVDLNLFGWRPATARLDASLASAIVGLRFIGTNVTVITPSIATMTPALLLDVLKSLLDIDLKSLLDLDLKDITVSLMHGDGSVSSASASDADADSDDDAGGGGTPGGSAPNPEANAPNDFKNDGDAPDKAPGQDEPQSAGINEGYGDDTVAAIYCEKVYGKRGAWTATGDDRFEFWVYETPKRTAQLYSGHTHADPKTAFRHLWTFDAQTADVICRNQRDPVRALDTKTFKRVGVGRQISVDYAGCRDNTPSLGLWALTKPKKTDRSKFVTSYKPVLCWRDAASGETYDLRVRLLFGGQFLGMIECPVTGLVPKSVEQDPLFKRACRDRKGLIELGTLDTDRADLEDNIITADEEFELIDIRARDVLVNGALHPSRREVIDVETEGGQKLRVTLFDVYGAGGVLESRRVLMVGPDGRTLTGTLNQNDQIVQWLETDGFRQHIFATWFAAGSPPEIVYSIHPSDLVLLRGSPGARSRELTWLFAVDAGAVAARKIGLDTGQGASRYRLTDDDIFAALASEVRTWPGGEVWSVNLGVAESSGVRLFIARQGEAYRLLLDLLAPPEGRQAGDYSTVERARRRECGSATELLANLNALVPSGVRRLSIADIAGVLADPDKAIDRMRPIAHPLNAIRQLPDCGVNQP